MRIERDKNKDWENLEDGKPLTRSEKKFKIQSINFKKKEDQSLLSDTKKLDQIITFEKIT
jgi:hypothetical protein